MASVIKYKDGYRAMVCVNRQRASASFRTKKEALAWASVREIELGEPTAINAGDKHTVADLIARYRDEISPEKRGARWEFIRANRLLKDPHFPNDMAVGQVTPGHLAAWRDSRLSNVSQGSVLRELSMISAMFETARREWRWIEDNPVRDVRKPSAPAHRERTIPRHEIRALLESMGYRPKVGVRSVTHAVAMCFLVALRTGMRAGELCGLTWDRVFPGFCRLPVTKTVPRDVPLTTKAERLIEKMRGYDPDFVFGIKTTTVDALFRKYRDRAGLSGFRFHDSRHTAATWLSHKVDVLTLCKIFGWSNTSQALTYYNPKAADIARKLNARG